MFPRFQRHEHQALGVHVLPTPQFKTNTLVLNLQAPLTAERVTKTALLPHLLVRGTEASPTQMALMARLEELYGAGLSADSFKLGERHILQLRLELPNGKFLPGKPELLKEGIAFMWEVLTRPAQEAGCFRSQVVGLEKEALRRRIEGTLDHKALYARVQALTHMHHHEPFSLMAFGRLSDLEALTPQALSAYHHELLAQAPMDLYVVGDVNAQAVAEELRQVFNLPTRSQKALPVRDPRHWQGQKKVFEERLDVGQCQVFWGLRSSVLRQDAEHPAMELLNAILGGYAHSKFFTQIREREGMAYSVQSGYNANMGTISCQAGVDPTQVDAVVTLMRAQVDAICQGQVSPEEMQQSKAMLALSVREQADSPTTLALGAYAAHLSGVPHDPDGFLARLDQVGLDEVVALAQALQEDTLYLLRDKHTHSNRPEAIQITAPFWA